MKKVIFRIEQKVKDGAEGVEVEVSGAKKELLATIVMAASESEELLDLLMDGAIASLLWHAKHHHGIDVIKLFEEKLEGEMEQQGVPKDKKGRTVN